MGRNPTDRKQVLSVLNAGAHRGAIAGISAFEQFNAQSTNRRVIPVYVDALPGRAATTRDLALRRGVESTAIEGRIEDILERSGDQRPIVLNLDRPAAIADVIRRAEPLSRPLLAYLLVKLPLEFVGLRVVLLPGEPDAWRQARELFEGLARVTARQGSVALVGADGAVADVPREELYRRYFAEHVVSNLGRVVSHTEPEHAPIEATTDGIKTMPVFVRSTETWSDPAVLARDFGENPPVVVQPGERFMMAEVSSAALRFHRIAYRRSDRTFEARGAVVLERPIEQETVSRRNGVLTTD